MWEERINKMKLIIFNGHATPMIAIGKHQCKLLAFAEKYPGWHSFKLNDKPVVNAVNRLHKKGYLEVINNQFRLNRKG